MKFMLDTCTLSDLLRDHKTVVARFLTTMPHEIAVSAVTVMEIEYGLALAPKIAERIQPRLDTFFKSVHVLPFSSDEARATGNIWADLKKTGKLIGAYDLMIAGTAVHHKLILVTSDTSDFERVEGLTLEDWRQ